MIVLNGCNVGGHRWEARV